MLYPTTLSINQWIKILLLNLCHPHHPHSHCSSQHPHHNCILHSLPLPNLCRQVNQSRIIGCQLATRMLILSLCCHLMRKMSNQLHSYHACVWLCTIDFRLPQIHLVCCENIFTSPPSIPTLLFLTWIFTKLEELTLYLFHHHLQLLFTGMDQLKWLWIGRTPAHPQNQMLRSIGL